MRFTDIFIKRPVLATVISLLILLFGLRALTSMQVRQFPKMENTVITVTTAYPGANAQLVQGFITTPLEKAIAGSQGVDYITSQSADGVSTIKVYITLNFNPETAFTNIMSKVSQTTNQLPQNAQLPIISKDTGSSTALMYIAFNSNSMNQEQITDYISRVVQPKLETIPGVSKAEIFGDHTFAMRIWLDPKKMAALNITPAEVAQALQQKNYLTAAGNTKSKYVSYAITATTNLHTAKEFKNIVIKNNGDSLVHLGDIAKVELGAENYDSSVIFNGERAIFVGISATPTANPLSVIDHVRKVFPTITRVFPPDLHAKIVYDATEYIRASIHEVMRTIFEATLIVVIVIFLFLGAFRSIFIPVVTIPLSIIGVCSLMLVLGYSINLLTLLAMVLAIGLVVDDAIVVVENIHRHMEEGLSAFNAALKGAREIALPIMAMSLTLAAVYAPIGFMGGVTGALFTEFAFTLAGAVLISGIIALTLSPMMCSRILNTTGSENRLVLLIDRFFESLKYRYQKRLHNALYFRPVTVVFAITVLVSCFFLYKNTSQELAPSEDQSVIFVSATAPEYANIDYTTKFTNEFNKIFKSFPEMEDYFIINGMGAPNNAFGGMILKPWNKRKKTQDELVQPLTQKLNQIPGLLTFAFPLPPLPVSGDPLPVQFVVDGITDYPTIYKLANQLRDAAMKSGLFIFVDNTMKYDKPEMVLHIDRNKAAAMGISMQEIGTALTTALGGNSINYFSMEGRSYEVIPQLQREYRASPQQINQIYIKTAGGAAIPLSTIASFSYETQPNSLTRFQQLNSATIEGLPKPGVSLGQALTFLQTEANKIFPQDVGYDFAGQSRQFMYEGNALIYTFFLSIIIIFLVLAAQFESFRDPLIILITVPMSICGALIPLNLGLATINIYTQIGLITLIGLISKHGILMVDFANNLQKNEGLDIRTAIEKAAAIRLRPILMTTAAMVLGVMPLVFAEGAGAVSRRDIGIVIATGMAIGTLFTLFVIPTMYTFFAKNHQKKS